MIDLNKHCDAVLSITSHGVRVKNVLRTLNPIIKCYSNVHVVLNLHSADCKFLSNDTINLIESGSIELFISSTDIGPHFKYYYSIRRFSNIPIIIVDDDIVYPDDFIAEMLDYHSKYPNCILSRRPEKIMFESPDKLLHYHRWIRPYFCKDPVNDSLPTGVGGILFPPNCFKANPPNIEEIVSKCKYDDDVYIKVLALRNNILIKSIQSSNMYKTILDDVETQSVALCASNWNRTVNSMLNFWDEIKYLYKSN